MSDIKILKPKVPGVSNRDPKTGERIPDEGKAVKMTQFWNRRLADGSMVEVGAVAPVQLAIPEEPETPQGEE